MGGEKHSSLLIIIAEVTTELYKISRWFIGVLLTVGTSFLVGVIFILPQEMSFFKVSDIFLFVVSLVISLTFTIYGIYLFQMRRQGRHFYWDDEGIVVDLKGNKVYWHEIESISLSNYQGRKATLIYLHYTHHESIRVRFQKMWGTTAYSIDWFFIERGKAYHKGLMKRWEEQQKKKHFS